MDGRISNLLDRKIIIISLASVCIFTSCKGSSDGFAPGNSVPVTPPPTTENPLVPGSSFLKNGTTVKSANGWDLQIDTSDMVKPHTTANGWNIEVKYE